MSAPENPAAYCLSNQARAELEKAIKATEYKYFGDYEMSADQREAVDVLVFHAQKLLAARGGK